MVPKHLKWTLTAIAFRKSEHVVAKIDLLGRKRTPQNGLFLCARIWVTWHQVDFSGTLEILRVWRFKLTRCGRSVASKLSAHRFDTFFPRPCTEIGRPRKFSTGKFFQPSTRQHCRCLTIWMELVELTNSIRWQDPNNNTDTEARCLVNVYPPFDQC